MGGNFQPKYKRIKKFSLSICGWKIKECKPSSPSSLRHRAWTLYGGEYFFAAARTRQRLMTVP